MKFCSECGACLILKVPPGEERLRYVCERCGTIHYQNPKIIAGTLPLYEGRILLCRRAIEPRYGLWTLPAGFMELGETLEEAACRETWEEAKAAVQIEGLHALYSIPIISQVYVFFRARLPKPEFGPGPESLEVKLFEPREIPWSQLAFSSVKRALRDFLEKPNQIHIATIEK